MLRVRGCLLHGYGRLSDFAVVGIFGVAVIRLSGFGLLVASPTWAKMFMNFAWARGRRLKQMLDFPSGYWRCASGWMGLRVLY